MFCENNHIWKEHRISTIPLVSIVIPTHNDSLHIIPSIQAITSHVSDMGIEWELIVADDGSDDETVGLLEDLELHNLRVLRADQRSGTGRAIQRGVLAARGAYVLTIDANQSTCIAHLGALLHKLQQEGHDIVLGSGLDQMSQAGMTGILGLLLRLGLGIRLRDTNPGIRLYTRDAAHRLHRAQTIKGSAFILEILYLANKFNYTIAQISLEAQHVIHSQGDRRTPDHRYLQAIGRIKLNDWRDRYQRLLQLSKQVKSTSTANKPLTIAIVTAYPPSRTSLNEYAYHFVAALRGKEDVERIYILADDLPDGQAYPSLNNSGAPVTIIPCWRFDAWHNALRIRKAIKNIQPDVVLFNIQFASFGSKRIPAALGLLTPALIKHQLHIPCVVLLHNIMETVDLKQAGFGQNPFMTGLTRLFGTIITRFLLQANLVALTIPKYVEILMHKYAAENVFLAPHGSFHQGDLPDFEQEVDCLRIMAFGKFGTYKRAETLIQAYERIDASDQRKTELIIAGDDHPNASGYLEALRQKYASVPNVRFTGYVAEADVPALFKQATVVVFPYTSTTGSSGVLHQAGSYGRPVVLPKIGDFLELIREEGYMGEFFEPGNVDSLAAAITRLLDDPQKRQQQGRNNFIAAQSIPIRDVVDWYLLHFQQILNTDHTS